MATENEGPQEFITANNTFAAVAYNDFLNRNEGNFLVSPLSAELVLAFTHSGCKGETAQEIRKAISLPDDYKTIEASVKNFLPSLISTEKCTIQNANKLYIKENFAIKEEFKKAATGIYQAEVENIDFEQEEKAAETMNKWVEERTNNKIKNLFEAKDINELSRVVIVNALYFKADWYYTMSGKDTIQSNFYVTPDEVISVDMMHYYARYNRHFSYYTSKELNTQFLELSFEGNASMVIALPYEKDGLATLEKHVDQVFAPHNFGSALVNLALPRFKIESTIDVKEILLNLGVKRAFDEDNADLSGIAGEKGDLLIDAIKQKTFIDVNEKGVEAAAATFVMVRVPKCGSNSQPVNFIADHPFIFYIKIKGAIAFAGRVTRPIQ